MVLHADLWQQEQGARVARSAERLLTGSIELVLAGAGGEPVDLWRTLDSHGFSELPPMRLPEPHVLEVTLATSRGRPRTVRISGDRAGPARIAVAGPRPSPAAVERLLARVRHVLRLDEDLSAFYAAAAGDPDLAWVASGAGRMLRSATVFEDVVKTICTTNCAWSATERMVAAIVRELGEPAIGAPATGPWGRSFPTPSAMASVGEAFYRDIARAGYRAGYLVSLARTVAGGGVDLEALGRSTPEEMSDAEIEAALLALPGVGPYAAAHIMMTIGRYSRLILDSWTRPKYARLSGRRDATDRSIERRFRRYGRYAGLAFWLYLTRDWVED
jgi:3-methyladenine DNA glycosylase/8-oxoguanine DNA glycosylase